MGRGSLKHRVVICGKKEMQLRSRNQQQTI
jgi:hypothetical protein